MRTMHRILFLFFSLSLIYSCENQEEEKIEKPINWSKDHSTEFGKEIAREEERDIKVYLKTRPEWEVEESGTGLRYWIYEENDGYQVKEGHIISVHFKVSLLDGTKCYETEEGETSTFMVDKSDVETGVQEAVKYMREGESAKLIVPSHLGHGLLGDLDKIPPMHPLVIDLQIKRIVNK